VKSFLSGVRGVLFFHAAIAGIPRRSQRFFFHAAFAFSRSGAQRSRGARNVFFFAAILCVFFRCDPPRETLCNLDA